MLRATVTFFLRRLFHTCLHACPQARPQARHAAMPQLAVVEKGLPCPLLHDLEQVNVTQF
jgi:hypothetical protein